MSNAWGTLSEHNANVQKQLNAERGIVAPDRTEPDETTETPQIMEVETPTVVLPDGRTVPVSEYDPFEKERAKLNSVTTEGILQYLTNANQSQTPSSNDEATEPEPLFKPFTFDEDDLPDDTDQKLVAHINAIGSALDEVNTGQNAKIDKLVETVSKLSDSVGRKFLDDEISTVSARTGFTEEELVAGNQETGLDDPQQVAIYLKGKKQEADELKKAQDEADAKRKASVSGISGTTGGGTTVSAGVGDITSQIMSALLAAGLPLGDEMSQQLVESKNLPENLNYRDPAEVAKFFNFAGS